MNSLNSIQFVRYTSTNGLKWTSYKNNLTFNSSTLQQNSLSFMSNSTLIASGTVSNINFGYHPGAISNVAVLNNPFQFPSGTGTGESIYGSNIGISIAGFFRPNTSGIWTFYLGEGNVNKSNDDGSVLWFNVLTPTNTNYSASQNYNYPALFTIDLISGNYYPILLNVCQSGGGSVIAFSFKAPGASTYTTDGNGFYFISSKKNN